MVNYEFNVVPYDASENLIYLIKYGINEPDLKRLIEHGIFSIANLAKTSKRELYSIKGLSDIKVERIVKAAKKIISLGFTSVKKLVQVRKNISIISTLNKKIDNSLYGGVETSSITEIFGENRTGKSQFCHILCVSAIISETTKNSNKKVIYIDTEGDFRPERLLEIAEHLGLTFNSLLKNIYYARAFNTEHQHHLLVAAASLIAFSNVKLMVVDSSTSLFRTEYLGRGELFSRQSLLGRFLRNLNKIAEEYNIAVVITNQVVTANLDGLTLTSGSNIKPIGGHIMAHYTNTRIWLKKGSRGILTMKITASSRLPESEVKFRILNKGFIDVNE